MDKNVNIEDITPEEMKNPFEEIKQTDDEWQEWWNSRQLARVLGYSKYWNFERLIEKVSEYLQRDKGLNLNEHFVEVDDTIILGNSGARKVKSLLMSRTACLSICMNADQRKPMVSLGKQYFADKLTDKETLTALESNMLVYRSSRGKVQVDVIFNNETFWLSRERMAILFGVTPQNISYHIQQISETGEVHLSEACKKVLQTSDNSSVDDLIVYNLDVVIAVGYRVNSYEATQFRIWATGILKEYMIKGFALDDERLKGKNIFGLDYFEELLERIREIRTSERRYYQKITDIYAECSMDYDKDVEVTKVFYKTVQNLMHWAVTHQTAAEIVYHRADAEKPHMGLTTWKNAPDGRVIKSDVTIAKNYLSEKEVNELNLLATGFLDMAEGRARRHILMTMQDWSDFLRKFLQLNDMEVLIGKGSVSHEQAEERAHAEYDKFRIIQDQTFLSDFDKLIGDRNIIELPLGDE